MASVKERLIADRLLIGSFIKTPTVHAIEILGSLDFDFVVIDEEHAPFDRATIDVAIVAARASGVLPFVRLADAAPARVLSAIDCGAVGILIPHVTDATMASAIAKAARFHGSRGYSGATRSAGFGAQSLKDTLAQGSEPFVVVQIEDVVGVDNITAIIGTPGIDAAFIGRADLAVSLGALDGRTPEVMAAAEKIAAATRAAGKAVATFAASAAEAKSLDPLGASLIVLGSDQSFLRRAAGTELQALRAGGARKTFQ